jgi:hypothetical protein
MEWRTIDSAPTDGTRVLVFEKDLAKVVGPQAAIITNRRMQGFPNGDTPWQHFGNFSHWMPLPNPPED